MNWLSASFVPLNSSYFCVCPTRLVTFYKRRCLIKASDVHLGWMGWNHKTHWRDTFDNSTKSTLRLILQSFNLQVPIGDLLIHKSQNTWGFFFPPPFRRYHQICQWLLNKCVHFRTQTSYQSGKDWIKRRLPVRADVINHWYVNLCAKIAHFTTSLLLHPG